MTGHPFGLGGVGGRGFKKIGVTKIKYPVSTQAHTNAVEAFTLGREGVRESKEKKLRGGGRN